MYDILVIGGGPAGLNAALYAARKELKVGLVAQGLGGQLLQTAEIENYLGFNEINAFDLVNKFEEHVKQYPIEIMTTDIQALEVNEDGTFTAKSSQGEYSGRACIVATGKRSRTLGIPGESQLSARGVSYCATCDGPMYRKKRVCIVGGGDSAVEAAIEMAWIAEEVHILIRSRLRADEILVRKMRETGKVKEWHHVIPVEVIGEKKVQQLRVRNTDTNEESVLDLDGVFIEIGGDPNTQFLPQEVELNENREVVVGKDCATNIPGLYAAGDINDYPQKQIIIAAADGAKAALAAHAWLLHRE